MEIDPSISVVELRLKHKQGTIVLNDLPEYSAWCHMISRCYNPSNNSYHHYGARGITVYGPWKYDFWLFFEHIGRRPHIAMSLDRIDNDGNYEPGNVRWATYKINLGYRSSN
jgi:hypothetical protein